MSAVVTLASLAHRSAHDEVNGDSGNTAARGAVRGGAGVLTGTTVTVPENSHHMTDSTTTASATLVVSITGELLSFFGAFGTRAGRFPIVARVTTFKRTRARVPV